MLQIISTWLGIFIMGICEVIFAKIILQQNIKIPRYILALILLVTSVIYTINNIYLVGTPKTLIVCIVHIMAFKYIFEISWSKGILLTLIYFILIIIPDLLELLFVTEIIGIEKEQCFDSIAGSLLANVSIAILFIIETYILRKPLKKLVDTKIENNTKIIVLSILTAICTLLFFYTMIKEYKLGENIVLYLVAMIVLASVLFSLMKQTIANNKLTKEYEKLLEYMKSYEKEVEKQRILRHETKNEFLTIKGKLCDKQNTKEIVEYIDEILNDKIKVKQEEYAKFCYLPANGIKGLCYFKTQEAQDKGLKTRINISKRVENSNIYKLNVKEQRDLGKILGVFLDNAIEASTKSTAKEFGIEGYLNINKECELIITNSYDGEIALNKIGKERFSTKGKNRGHGLLLVKHLVSKNDKFEIKTEVINGLYIQTITIKKPIK